MNVIALTSGQNVLFMNPPDLTEDKLVSLMRQDLHLTIPTIETNLFRDGGMDSLVFIDLLMLLEREFFISIDMTSIELEQFESVKNIVMFIHQQHLLANNIPLEYSQL